MYNIKVTREQLDAVSELFKERGWEVVSQSEDSNVRDSRFRAMQHAADEYVETRELRTHTVKGRPSPQQEEPQEEDHYVTMKQLRGVSPEGADDSSPPQLRKSRGNAAEDRDPFFASKREINWNKQSFKDMKTVGHNYTALKSSLKESKVLMPVHPKSTDCKQQWRSSSLDPAAKQNTTPNLLVGHHLVKAGDKVKIITSLSTEHVNTISRVPVRIVLAIDRSGSMLNKLGRHGKDAKITKVKHFASSLVSSLDDGDEAAIVTFGDEAEIFLPLIKISNKSKGEIARRVDELDRGSMSQHTNLSAGLKMALKAFHEATKSQSDYLKYKNSILVFSDGDVNAGTTDANSLVHEVRSNIRQMVPSLDETTNQWVTISVITTGSSWSEQAYLLSKACSSEAYYYIDSDNINPEVDLFLPVLLRKTAVAWNISCVIDAYHGVTFLDSECTQDYRVRIRRSRTAAPRSGKAFFLYDLPAGTAKHIGIAADLSPVQDLEQLEPDTDLFKLRIEYTDTDGERFWQEKSFSVADIKLAGDSTSAADLAAVYKHDLRTESQAVLRKAAEHVKDGDTRGSRAVILDGQQSIQTLIDKIKVEEMDQTRETVEKEALTNFATSVVETMGSLIECLETKSEGHAWNKMKAVSTAIAREAPNVSETVVNEDLLCPLPTLSHMETAGMKDPLEQLAAKHGGVARKRITVGNLDDLLADMANGEK